MEKLNLVEILKDCPKGTKLYSPLFGEVTFNSIDGNPANSYQIWVLTISGGLQSFTTKGKYHHDYDDDNECMLFPSKENRDWSTFKLKKPKFDPKSLQPFDKVLVRNNHTEHWNCNIFSFVYNEKIIRTAHGSYVQVIPYNNETKHLVGTKNDCP